MTSVPNLHDVINRVCQNEGLRFIVSYKINRRCKKLLQMEASASAVSGDILGIMHRYIIVNNNVSQETSSCHLRYLNLLLLGQLGTPYHLKVICCNYNRTSIGAGWFWHI